MTARRRLLVYDLGRVEYADGLDLMRRAGEAVRAGSPPDADYLFLLEHPPVLTMGRGAKPGNVVASRDWLERQGFELHETDRGGDVTYHGPGQLVGYPVVNLSARPDVRRYVSDLEEAMIRACADYGVAAARHPEHRGAWVPSPDPSGRVGELPVPAGKIGAVGVHFSRWITSHGFAFNVAPDLSHFRAIVPCGIADPRLGVTSLAAERGSAPPMAEVADRVAGHLAGLLDRAREDRVPELRTVSVVPVREDGKLLLLRRAPDRGGFWQPVTGRVEPGETPEAAARRELEEETGSAAEVTPLGYEHAFSVDPGLLGAGAPTSAGGLGVALARESAFIARLPSGFEPRLSGEHEEHAWVDPAEAMARIPHAGLRRAVGLSRLATG